MAAAACAAFGAMASDVSYWFEGAKMHVRATSALSGKGLLLLWDETDKGETAASWANSTNFTAAVPAAGGEYTIDLASLGIANGTPCRIASATCYERLTMLLMADRGKYIDTGIQGKNVYGVRMGFYPTKRGTAGTADANFALNCGKAGDTTWTAGKGGFHIGLGQNANVTESLEGPVLWGHHGYGSVSSERPNWETNAINHIAFTNRVFTLNGVIVKSGLNAGAISTNDLTVTMGRNNPSNYYSLCGYWSYLQFDDENGKLIVDYIPVRRTSDNKVGFWDSVSKTLVVPTTENQNLSAGDGTPTGEVIADSDSLEVVSDAITPDRQLATTVDGGKVTVTVPAGLSGETLIVAWDESDKGDDITAWAHTADAVATASAGNTAPIRLSGLGVTAGSTVRIFAANAYKPLDMLQMTTTGCWIDTGFKGTDVYGVRFGYYTTGLNKKTGDWCGAIGCGKDNWNLFASSCDYSISKW